MAHWMCTTCGYYLQTLEPPNRCPSCEQTCVFTNVTCYQPDCGGEQIDPVLMGNTLRLLKGVPEPVTKPTLPSSHDIYLVDILNGLDEQQRQQFKSVGCIENYQADVVICTEGEEARKFYLVERGQVVASTQPVKGVRFPISIINAGFAFGWSALVPPYRYTATITAMFKTRVLAFEREALLSMMRENPSLGLNLMQNIGSVIASRLRTVELELAGLIKRES
ncbi:MAG TPA: cyclic nucleotide-binding domain-containing protein [Dehalococcoidia bacterium]|nr:cyclic nucleotide-binding domain-containing protein [Dehalococcoidia bacterium]